MIIYIRHSDDEDNDPTFIHDPKLTSKGVKLAHKKGKKLIKKYGIPEIIYLSPFRRAKQTLAQLLLYLSEEQKNKIQIIEDPLLSRYFSSGQQKKVDVHRDTKRANIPVKENKDKLNKRVKTQVEKMKENDFHINDQVIWCITHAIIIKKISSRFHVETPSHIPFVYHFKVKKSH